MITFVVLFPGNRFLCGHCELLCWKTYFCHRTLGHLFVLDAELFLIPHKGHTEAVFYEIRTLNTLSECFCTAIKYFLFRREQKCNWSDNAVSAQKNQVNKEAQPEPLEHTVRL